MSELQKYYVSSGLGASFQCGVNGVVLEQGTAVYLAADIDAALATARREVWEEAAVIVEADCIGDISVEFDGITKEQQAHNLNQIELAAKLRAQAAKEQP